MSKTLNLLTTILLGFALLGFAVLLLAGCDKYDDSKLTGRVDELENRVTELEKLVSDLNTTVQSLSTLVRDLQDDIRVVSMTTLETGGYELTLSNGQILTIKNGEDGKEPSIGVKEDETGTLCWTVNGEFLKNDGANVPVSVAPEFEIRDGQLYYKVGDGEWQLIEGSANIGVVKDVRENDDKTAVIIELANGSTIEIPKVQTQTFSLNIENTDIAVSAGETTSIKYTIIAADDATKVTAVPVNGYTVKVTSASTSEGTLEVTAPDPLVDADIYVVAVNGAGLTSAKILSFAEGQLNVVKDVANIDANGGEVSFTIETNLQYGTPTVDPQAQGWIEYIPATKALRTDVLTFNVKPNDTGAERQGQISIPSEIGVKKVTVIQSATAEVSGGSADLGTLNTTAGPAAVGNGTTTNGWNFTNILGLGYTNWSEIPDDGSKRPALAGSEAKTGVATSPVLNGGCGTLSIKYGTASPVNMIKNGLSFKVELKSADGSAVLATQTVTENPVTAKQVYNANLDFNVSGDFIIVITNLRPSQSTNVRYDAVCLLDISWTGYSN